MSQEINSTLPACTQKQSANKTIQTNSLDWVDDCILSQKEVNDIATPEWIVFNLVISGHIILIPAEPNGGKTAVFFYLAGRMRKKGFQVFYVNADISGGDAKPLYEEAKRNDFKLLLPDMREGQSMDTVLEKLRIMSEDANRYDDVIFIFDTLKKILDVIQKSAAKKFFKIFRRLSGKGMTIILLAHTNKYKDEKTGMPMYEGTGDLRSDVDELIYLLPEKHDDGSMTVTTYPDKTRGDFKPITFKIDSKREVSMAEKPVDTLKMNQVTEELKTDEPTIEAIRESIESGCQNQKDIVESCKDLNIGERIVKSILNKYCLHLTSNRLN